MERSIMWLTPYAGANRIRFNGTLSAGALSGVGTPVNGKGNLPTVER
jgi:hypothetical protein